ncbi:hypothetical protein FH972_001643 [Carpinus fangiana]|uniref:Uncharacterized protein n=1 Tax=Carpinus fangiana TaxID=176857 RepID=A0A5N6QCR3_9ROSI|nr:hypothetical protein FH972_001643 [Carpinus fangiana]
MSNANENTTETSIDVEEGPYTAEHPHPQNDSYPQLTAAQETFMREYCRKREWPEGAINEYLEAAKYDPGQRFLVEVKEKAEADGVNVEKVASG